MAKSKLYSLFGNPMTTRSGKPTIARLAACALLAAFAVPAIAQYVWLDEKGVKQYSDMPPPASVPDKRILKQPGTPAPANPSDQPDTADAVPPKTAPTLAEQNAAFRKRQQEAAEKEKKTAEHSRLAAEKAKNCDRARGYLRSLESGERIAHTDRNGERVFLSDEQRSAEMHDARQALANCNN